jgi:hypothetical protein
VLREFLSLVVEAESAVGKVAGVVMSKGCRSRKHRSCPSLMPEIVHLYSFELSQQSKPLQQAPQHSSKDPTLSKNPAKHTVKVSPAHTPEVQESHGAE